MPPKDRLRLNDLGRTEQARPEPGHPYQQRPVTAAQSKTRRRAPQGDAELMKKKQVLGLKPAPRLEQVGDEHSERVQDRKHRSERCDDSTSRRESSPDGIFGKDTQKIPFRTRRSSTRGMPRGLFGRNDLMAAHSKSVSSYRMIRGSGLDA